MSKKSTHYGLSDEPKEPFSVNEIIPLKQLADRYVSWVVNQLNGDQREAAFALGVTQKTVYNRTRNKDVQNI